VNALLHSILTLHDLFQIDQRKVFALIINVENLVKLREGRLKLLGLEPDAKYADPVKVADEIEWCMNFIRKNPRWRIVDISNRAIEEVAASIVNSYRSGGKPV
jgi:hypothetical protein